MEIKGLSTCFCINDIDQCREFYLQHFSGKIIFDCGWYINMQIGNENYTIQFMKPQGEMPHFTGKGITINFKVEDVDLEYNRLMKKELKVVMPLENHPWGDRGFSVLDPIGNAIYIYSDREPSEEFKKFFTNKN